MRLENICITALLLVSSTLSYAQKNREKTDVNVPAIASADSVKMPVDSVLTAQDSSNLAKLNQSLKPVKKKRDWSTWHPEAKELCGWRSSCREQAKYTIVSIGNCLSYTAVS